jgi:hypothetical protein
MLFLAALMMRSFAGKISSPFRRISTRLPDTTVVPAYAERVEAKAGFPTSRAGRVRTGS